MDLRETSERLVRHFDKLRSDRREHDIYLIEHPLDADEIERLRKVVFQRLRLYPLTDASWNEHAVILCVLATEVGYRYRGTGTEFWPVLARDLGISTTGQERSCLVKLFEKVALRYGIRRPGQTDWEKHFPLISWPVGNAVAPMEIHFALARALRQAIRQGIRPSAPQDFLSRLRAISVGLSSVRFSAWLDNAELALEVSGRLLRHPVEGQFLPQKLIDRIFSDLNLDSAASRSLSQARALLANSGRRSRLMDVPRCSLLLHPEGAEGERILMRGPVLSAARQQEVIVALDQPGDRLVVRGGSIGVSLTDLLSGAMLPLPGLKNLAEPLLSSTSESETSSEIALKLLGDLEPIRSGIFERRRDHSRYVAVPLRTQLNEASDYCVCPVGEDFRNEARWRFLSPEIPEELEALRQYLSVAEDSERAQVFFGLPAVTGENVFMAGFPVIGKAGQPNGRFVPEASGEQAVESAALSASSCLSARLSEGRWTTPDGQSIDVVTANKADIASIEFDHSHLSIDDFLAGNLSLVIRAPLPLRDVSVEVDVRKDSRRILSAVEKFDRIPLRLTGFSPIFRQLREAFLQNDTLLLTNEVELTVDVHELCRKNVKLSCKAVGFVLTPSGRFVPSHLQIGAEAEYGRLEATVGSPVLGSPGNLSDIDDPRLIVPAVKLRGALASGVITVGQERVRLEGTGAIDPLPWVREAGNIDEKFGLGNIARSLTGWRLARADNVIGEFHRRRAAMRLEMTSVAQLCGQSWCELEKLVDVSLLDPLSYFLRLAYQRELTTGPQCPELPDPNDRMLLHGILFRVFAETLKSPEQELAYWDEERGGVLDLLVSRAYDELAEKLGAAGRPVFEEVDVVYPHTRWRDTLQDTAKAVKLTFFRRLILPDTRWTALAETNFHGQSVDDTIDLLDRSHLDVARQAGQRRIGREELRALLLFWLAPAKLEELGDWDEPLMRCLSDIFTSRAARYAVLQHRIAEHDLPDSGSLQ